MPAYERATSANPHVQLRVSEAGHDHGARHAAVVVRRTASAT